MLPDNFARLGAYKTLFVDRGARRNFSRGGQAMYLLSTGLNKTLLLQPGFAKGLEPKVEMILFKKCCNWTAC